MTQVTGKILVVDNEYDDTIKQAVSAIVKHGMPVQYWDSKGDLPDYIRNVRVVIIDINLTDSPTTPSGTARYAEPVKALRKIPGPYLVVIMANDFIKKRDPQGLTEEYFNIAKKPICGVVAEDGINKNDELVNPELLTTLIEKSIKDQEILKLIYLWEDVIDKATDMALADFIPGEIKKSIEPIIAKLTQEVGAEAAPRELVDLLMQLVSRRVCASSTFDKLKDLILNFNNSKKNPEKEEAATGETNQAGTSNHTDKDLCNKIMYYCPSDKEQYWTGDILITKNQEKFLDYAIIINAPCDLAQKKTWSYRICAGFEVKDEFFEDQLYPPYKVDHAVKDRITRENGSFDLAKAYAKKRYADKEGKLTEGLFMLFNVNYKGSYINLCFDFNNIQSIDQAKLAGWNRVCRLDSPFLEVLLQKYGTHAFRVGAMPVNHSV